MKTKFLIVLLIAVCLCLCACSGRDASGGSSGSRETEQASDPSEKVTAELSEADMASMREYAISFAEFFDTPFSSVDDLDYEMIGYNSLYWISTDESYCDFETDNRGYPYIPKELLKSYVWEHFGIENYEYPVSDNPNILPQYNPDNDAYLFSSARGGPRSEVSILDEMIIDQAIVYTMKFETPNFETGEIMETRNMEYTFQAVPTAAGYILKIKSAVEL